MEKPGPSQPTHDTSNYYSAEPMTAYTIGSDIPNSLYRHGSEQPMEEYNSGSNQPDYLNVGSSEQPLGDNTIGSGTPANYNVRSNGASAYDAGTSQYAYDAGTSQYAYDGNPRDSVTSQSPIIVGVKDGGFLTKRRCWIRGALIIAVILIILAISVTLGVTLSQSDDPCSACDCETSILVGQITDNNKCPLSGATISYADQPINTLAITNFYGAFRITGVCATPQKLLVTRPLHTRVKDTTTCGHHKEGANCTSFFHAQLRRIELPFIVDHPRSKLRLAGQSVAFCCIAESMPPPEKYEWFKNGFLVDNKQSNKDRLLLTDLETDDSGMYTCRVHNEAGPVVSTAAKLIVTATTTGCKGMPSSKLIQLPEDCVQFATNRSEYDIQTCGNRQCSGRIDDQTQCEDPESESYCCQTQTTQTVQVQCQGYTIPVLKTTSCECAQCAAQSSVIVGRVVLATNFSQALDSISVTYENKEMATTNTLGQFSFSTRNSASKVPLSFHDLTILPRVLNTTVVFQISTESMRYDTIKMVPLNKEFATFDGKKDATLPILNSGGGALAEITIAENSVRNVTGVLYSSTVRVTVNSLDMRNKTEAGLVPGDSTTVDEKGYPKPLRLFGVFSLQFTDPHGLPLFVTGHPMIQITHPLGFGDCKEHADSVCDVQLWGLNTKTGIWEQVSYFFFTELEVRRQKRQDVPLVVANLVLHEYEWYGIGDIDSKERCWAKLIGYADADFNPISHLPYIYRVTAVIGEERKVENDIQESVQIYRVSSSSAITTHGPAGVCIPLVCPKERTGGQTDLVEAYVSATYEGVFLQPGNPTKGLREKYVSLSDEDVTNTNYYIAYDIDVDVDPQILLNPIPISTTNGPVYSGMDAGNPGGICSEADTSEKHFQIYCNNCADVICNTFHSYTNNPIKRQPQTFYPDLQTNFPGRQSYCFVGIRIMTDSKAVRVMATSSNSIGGFYGRREITARKANSNDDYVDVCMEFKCSGKVVAGMSTLPADITKVIIDVKDKEQYTCNAKKQASDFMYDGQKSLPLKFDDPKTYGERTGIQKDKYPPGNALCLNDEVSPQKIDTDRCKLNGNFIAAATVTCSLP